MTNLENVESFISTANEESLTALEVAISQARTARIAERNAALPEYPWVTSLDVPKQGHRAGTVSQVSRASAVELIEACTHRLATTDEVAAFNSQIA